jgi:hypothetical protein
VPAIVRSMLQDTWTQALARVHRAEGEDSALWHGLLGTVDDLLWSVEPKTAPEDRKRLVTMLPGMLKRLQLGLRARPDGRSGPCRVPGALSIAMRPP